MFTHESYVKVAIRRLCVLVVLVALIASVCSRSQMAICGCSDLGGGGYRLALPA